MSITMSITMSRMTATGVLLMVFLSVVDFSTFPDIALLNGTVTLPCTCFGPVLTWDIFSPIKTRIAIFEDGILNVTKPFEKRFSFSGNTRSGNFSMSISSILYNDAGKYKCTCNGQEVSGGTLRVYYPQPMTAYEGENITLRCYGDTRKDTKDVQWRKDVTELLAFNSTKPDEAVSGRFSVSKWGIQDGDLSLQISSVELSDAGVYRLLFCSESCEGDPRAILLKVEKRQQEHQPATPPNSFTQDLGIGVGIGVGIVVLIGVIIAVIIGVTVYTRSKRPRETTPLNVRGPIQEEFPMIPMKPSSTQRFQDYFPE